ncbi:MAG: NADAR family protein [Planctomycetales bacterium]|nr:NADAR family protein [Planctomycetales bacterium]
MAILFYSSSDQWAFLSNFSRHGFELDDAYWMTVEHYFQAAKFFPTDPEHAEAIRVAATPKQAKTLGRSRRHPLRADWEAVKDDIMRSAVRAKFVTHLEIRNRLLATGDERLVENAPMDYYWGCGRSGAGLNRLGEILMELRDELARDVA